jgi:hypothetical protein
MAYLRTFLLAAVVPLTLAACGGGGGGGEPTPVGTHYHYVANKIYVPTNNTEARSYGLDLDGNGTVDNQLGMVLGTLSGMGFDIQGTIDKSVAEGDIDLLADFQTQDFMNTAAAGVQVFLGDNAQPAACNSGEMYTCDTSTPPVCSGCGHQLSGSASFGISADSPTNTALSGPIVNGTFKGGPGDLGLAIAIGGTTPVHLDLIGARASGSGITATAIGTATTGGIVFGGAVTQDDLNNNVIPAIQMELGPLIQRDCCGLSTSPGGTTCDPSANPSCGCTDGSTGKTILGLFDTNPKDCTVSVMEIQTNTLIQSLLAPDVTIEGKMALSLGIKATAVNATYTVTGEM